MKLIIENWRRYINEQASAGQEEVLPQTVKALEGLPSALKLQDLKRSRDMSEVLDFVEKTIQAPEIKKMIKQGKVLHRWTTSRENHTELGTAAWISRQDGTPIITYARKEWADQVESAFEFLKQFFKMPIGHDKKLEGYKEVVKSMAITGFAPTVVHEYGHHTDPENPIRYMPDFDLTDPEAPFPEIGMNYTDFELDELENYAQRSEKEYVDYIYATENSKAMKYVLGKVADFFEVEDLEKIAFAVHKHGQWVKSLQIID